jgi:hypothetical protein
MISVRSPWKFGRSKPPLVRKKTRITILTSSSNDHFTSLSSYPEPILLNVMMMTEEVVIHVEGQMRRAVEGDLTKKEIGEMREEKAIEDQDDDEKNIEWGR